MAFTKDGTYYAATTANGFPDRPDGRKVRMMFGGGFMVEDFPDHRFKDRYGKTVPKSPLAHRYDFDTYLLHRDGANETIRWTIDSRELYRGNSKLHDKLTTEIFGNTSQYWDKREPAKIKLFLAKYFKLKNVKLVLVERACNEKNGYEYYLFSLANKKPTPRISVARHEAIIAKLKLDHALEKENLEVWLGMARAGKTYNREYATILEKIQESATTEIRYAHSNVRAGNLDAAGTHLTKARKILNA